MQVLVCGRHGQLARALAKQIPVGMEVQFCGAAELDIRDASAVTTMLDTTMPAWVINAAAYTAVDRAETDIEAAFALNACGPENLARVCALRGIRLLHISTDFVFDGLANAPYHADAPTSPLNIYGHSKLAGERAVQQILPESLIIRCGWLYSAHGQNFVKTILRLMAEREVLNVVKDQQGVPTSADSLAALIWSCVQRGDLSGVQHWADGGSASWYEFALEIARQATERGMLARMPVLNAITSAQYPTAAKRPAYSVLNNECLAQHFAINPQPWPQALGMVLDELKRNPNA